MAMLQQASVFPATTVHGFSTREGGVSQGRYASLNLSHGWGDDPLAVAENLRRVAAVLNFKPSTLVTVKQVHSARALRAREVTARSEADALWARRGDAAAQVLGVRTADCVPVLLATRDGQWIAAIHSGWKGTASNIVGTTIAAMVADGAVRHEIVAAIGPCIEVGAFEVGPEVAALFPGSFVQLGPRGRPHVDLVACVRRQAIEAGVWATSIERVGGCTHTLARSYFSYRRDGAGIGQQLALIGFR